MGGVSAIITCFITAQGFPKGLPGTMVVFGSFVAALATVTAIAGRYCQLPPVGPSLLSLTFFAVPHQALFETP